MKPVFHHIRRNASKAGRSLSLLSCAFHPRLLHVVAALAKLSADAGRFTIYKLQHPVGDETYETTTESGVRTLSVQWAFRLHRHGCVAPRNADVRAVAGLRLHPLNLAKRSVLPAPAARRSLGADPN